MPSLQDYKALRAWLSTQDPSWLADRLLTLIPDGSPERAVIDLHRTLLDHHAEHPHTLDVDRCRALITRAIVPSANALHSDKCRISIAIQEILHAISAAAANGDWNAFRDLSACAIDAIDKAYEYVDEGWTFEDPYVKLCDLHLRACHAAPSDPIALKAWLVKKDWDSVSGNFSASMKTYRSVL